MSWLALPALLLQNIWVVDDNGGPGVNFTDIPPAIAAASDGDVLLVQPGTYSHFVLSGKGLRILGAGAANTTIVNPTIGLPGVFRTEIGPVPPASVVYVDRMQFLPSGIFDTTLRVLGSTTRAALADVTILGYVNWPAMEVYDGEVHAFRSTLVGGNGSATYVTPQGGSALTSVGARIHLAGCFVKGATALRIAGVSSWRPAEDWVSSGAIRRGSPIRTSREVGRPAVHRPSLSAGTGAPGSPPPSASSASREIRPRSSAGERPCPPAGRSPSPVHPVRGSWR
ncbi:MAG: hypothetical protein L0323_01095 [Planctomycetes bacterium]|nr:hypothetical protein [Planctomycetota bacterium]